METYYKTTVKIAFEDKKGNLKYKSESYIVYAISPTDVETQIAEHLKGEDYEIKNISVSNIVDILGKKK
jgi:hypothetical protein